MTYEALMRWETEGGASLSTKGAEIERPDGVASGLDQAAADRVAREFDAVAHAELVEDVLPMALDDLDADEERARDLL